MNIEANLSTAALNKIVSAGGSVGGSSAVGVVTYVALSLAEITTSGECNVTTSTCVAGDWFTSDAEGLAVKVTSGLALGRILADPVDGLSLAVIGVVNL